ncbi:MAG: glycoside hydrolase family 9 protein [Candidatus Riflebacteria bacterium]|nr:glycoside hydrolase family 9 protein [Candidatus Riflebacteria bacterium]
MFEPFLLRIYPWFTVRNQHFLALCILMTLFFPAQNAFSQVQPSEQSQNSSSSESAANAKVSQNSNSKSKTGPKGGLNSSSQIVDVRILSNQIICIVLDSTKDVLNRKEKKFNLPASLEKVAKVVPDWLKEKRAFYQVFSTWIDFRLEFVKKLEDNDYWTVNGTHPEQAVYWPQSIDAFPENSSDFPCPPKTIGLPRIADYVFLRLKKALIPGKPLHVQNSDEESKKLFFDDLSTICWSIKVNQVGYLASASKKIAYLGMWAGPMGAVDFSSFDGTAFQVYRWESGQKWNEGNATGTSLFSGKIKLRAAEKSQRFKEIPITGEDVYEMDFSDFKESGRFCIVVPGLGRSWPFKVSEDTYGEVFFTVMKGIFAQRCGIELKPPYSNWTRNACHLKSFRGGFPPEIPNSMNNWYNSDKYDKTSSGPVVQFGFRDSSGKPERIGTFEVIQCTKTQEKLEKITGGWHDAADFDRRTAHFEGTLDLCAAFEMYPEKFCDGQLEIPESGNGIPDILDEALIPVEFFKKTQTPEGGISGWVEQTSHPRHDRLPDLDDSPFYVSLPERNASLAYSSVAAYLGRLLAKFDKTKSAELIESAKKAFSWGLNPNNSIRGVKFEKTSRHDKIEETKTILFDQMEPLPGLRNGKANPFKVLAAIQLFLATEDNTYRERAKADDSLKEFYARGLPDDVSPFAFVTPLLNPKVFGEDGNSFLLSLARKEADLFIRGQSNLAYRTLWRPPDHTFYSNLSWGGIHAGRRAQFPLIVWRVTGEQKYLEAALLGLDWELGCNEMGRCLVTGLGSIFPVIFQHIMSEQDLFLEPYPGFVPFTFSMGIAPVAYKTLFGLIEGGHPSVKDFFDNSAFCLLPSLLDREGIQAELDKQPKIGDWTKPMSDIIKGKLEPIFPIMRRVFVHPYLVPQQNEFTIFESLTALAAVSAILIPDGWKPGPELKNRLPKTNFNDLPIYFQP